MFILLIIVTNLGTLIADDAMSDGNLQCFNDYDKSMVCHFTTDKSKCAEYNMTLKLLGAQNRGKNDCTFKEKERSNDVSKCGCSIDQMHLIIGEEFNATLWNSGKRLNSKVLCIKCSIKPKTPTIQDVKPTENGNFLVKWRTNYPDNALFPKVLIAELSYRKKGETDEVSRNESTTSHELLGRDLEPNTIYALKVRTYTDWSGHFSDWSEELEFTNPASSRKVLQIVIVFSCIAVIIITSALFWCSVRLKTMLWDNIPKCSNPDLLYMVPGVPKVLSPPKILLSSIYVDSLKMDTEGKTLTNPSTVDGSSGRGSGSELESSSSLGYAQTCSMSPEPSNVQIISHLQEALSKVFPSLVPLDGNPQSLLLALPMTDDGTEMNCPESNRDIGVCSSDYNPLHFMGESGGSCGLFCYNNITYSPSVPLNSLQELTTSKTSSFPMQPLLFCNSFYHSGEAEVLKNGHPQLFLGTGQQDLNLSTNCAPLLQTDFSYHPCDGASDDSETTMSAEDTSLIYGSNDSNVSKPHNAISVVAGYQNFSEAVGKDNERGTDAFMDVPLPLKGFQDVDSSDLPDPGCCLPPSDGDYQTLQSLGQNSPDQWVSDKLLNKCLETEIPQSSMGNMPLNVIPNSQGGQCPIPGSPFLTAFCSDQAMQIDNDSFHCI
uniref:Fibronectin type-III domain-containing protein n=1 Tax=Salmo trutta TaxID=8032 RepID=A0A673VUF9_SALTR